MRARMLRVCVCVAERMCSCAEIMAFYLIRINIRYLAWSYGCRYPFAVCVCVSLCSVIFGHLGLSWWLEDNMYNAIVVFVYVCAYRICDMKPFEVDCMVVRKESTGDMAEISLWWCSKQTLWMCDTRTLRRIHQKTKSKCKSKHLQLRLCQATANPSRSPFRFIRRGGHWNSGNLCQKPFPQK